MSARPAPAPPPGLIPQPAVAAAPVSPGSVSPETVLGWLAEVPDPEIPVVSVTDLGIVRDVAWAGETLEVTVTPTYSGCPATRVIETMIETTLRARGIEKLALKQQLSPPWTTDWITPAARDALERFGVAPPQAAGGPKRCPRCKSDALEMVSAFGSTPCKAQWRCLSCLEPFDYFKCL